MIGPIWKKIFGFTGEVATDAVVIGTLGRIWKSLKTPEFKEVRQGLISHGAWPFGLGLADEADFLARVGKGLKPEEVIRLTNFLVTLTDQERTKVRCTIAAIKEFPDRQTFSAEKGGRKTTKEYTARIDDALAFLQILASDKLSNAQRKKLCKGLGLLDFPDIQLSARLATAAKKVRKTRKSLEKKYGPLKAATPASSGHIDTFFNWLNRVFPV
ncbi:MAG: hypothetical protein WC643_00595 [Parcubacteria group bacterium]|jgi:hypothetical protein